MLRGHRSASPLFCGRWAAVPHCLTTGASARIAGHSSHGLRRLVQTHTNPTAPVGGAAPQPPPVGEQPPASTPGEQLKKLGATGAKVWRFFRGAVLLVAVGSGVLLYNAYKLAESIPEDVVLKLNFEKPFPEAQTSQFLPVLTLQDVVDGLDTAAKDPRVKAVVATLGSETMELPIAQVQELRDALKKFRETHKPAVCHVEAFNGNTDYYLATAFDHIVMQSSGWLALTGVAVSPLFFRGLFDKLDIESQMLHRHEYKNFANTFNEKGFTPAHREATESMATSLHQQLVNGIAEARNIAPSRLQTLIDQGPLLPREALEEGLVDRLDFRDGAYALLKARVAGAQEEAEQAKAVVATPAQSTNKQVRFMSFKKYVKKTKEEKELANLKRKSANAKLLASDAVAFQTLKDIHDKQVGSSPNAEDVKMRRKLIRRAERGKSGLPKVAVIYAAGEIVSGYHEQPRVVASKNISEAIRAAVRDKDVKAIVLRVNSPGGSAVASNTIWWETIKAKAAGLPIVVSMGDYAASGGYYISAAADHIIAQPATLTGSIGVVFGKLVFDKFLANKLGVTQETVEKGEHANFLSPTKSWNPAELALCNKFLDESYRDFVSKVASGRGFTFEQAHKIAKGRVWTGAEAKELGLVDELGGLSRAVEVAKDLAGPLPPGVDYDVMVLPRPKSLREVIFKGSAYSDANEDEDEQPESSGGFGSLMEQMSHEWGTAARLVRFLSSLPMVKSLLREARSSSGAQYRMDDISVSSKESDLV